MNPTFPVSLKKGAAIFLMGLSLSISAVAESNAQLSITRPNTGVRKALGGGIAVDKGANPAMSVSALVGVASGEAVSQFGKGLQLQDVQAIFSAAVDGYFYGNVVLNTRSFTNIMVQEAYATTLSLPFVTAKVGKFYADFGRNNRLHLRGQPLIDTPLVNQAIFTTNGINSLGVEVSSVFPFSSGRVDLSAAVLDKADFIVPGESPEEVLGVGRAEATVNLGESLQVGAGGSYLHHKNLKRWGADLVVRFGGNNRGDFGLEWTNEYIDDTKDTKGAYSTLLARVLPQIWVGGRFDYVKLSPTVNLTGEQMIVAYVPSESSMLRLQGGGFQSSGQPTKWQVIGQFAMTLGSHPGHAY